MISTSLYSFPGNLIVDNIQSWIYYRTMSYSISNDLLIRARSNRQEPGAKEQARRQNSNAVVVSVPDNLKMGLAIIGLTCLNK